jgi:hypothetical protein
VTKHKRVKVKCFIYEPNETDDEMSRRLFSHVGKAVLECGHERNLGVQSAHDKNYMPKRMACPECGQLNGFSLEQ